MPVAYGKRLWKKGTNIMFTACLTKRKANSPRRVCVEMCGKCRSININSSTWQPSVGHLLGEITIGIIEIILRDFPHGPERQTWVYIVIIK